LCTLIRGGERIKYEDICGAKEGVSPEDIKKTLHEEKEKQFLDKTGG